MSELAPVDGRSSSIISGLSNSPDKNVVLHNPVFDQPFILQTDASHRGIQAVLLQGPPDAWHPIAFISRKLFQRKVHYSIVEKECLAVKWALDLKYYLLGREFSLEMDHKALQWLEKMKDTNSRITCWYLAMQPFRFTIQHVPGKDYSRQIISPTLPVTFMKEGIEWLPVMTPHISECWHILSHKYTHMLSLHSYLPLIFIGLNIDFSYLYLIWSISYIHYV